MENTGGCDQVHETLISSRGLILRAVVWVGLRGPAQALALGMALSFLLLVSGCARTDSQSGSIAKNNSQKSGGGGDDLSGGSGGSGGATGGSDKVTFSPECQDAFQVGIAASQRSAPEIIQPYFGKSIDISHLRAIAKSSIQGSLSYANQIGVTTYKMPVPEMAQLGCPFFSNLSNPGAPLSTLIQQLSEQAKASRGLLLGIYIPQGSRITAGEGAQIALFPNANRKILIHELTHHLFTIAEESVGVHDGEALFTTIKDTNQALSDLLKTAKDSDFADTQFINKWYQQLNILLTASYFLTKNFALEEVANELLLQDLFEQNFFENFDYSRKESRNYIMQSISSGAKQIAVLKLYVTRSEELFGKPMQELTTSWKVKIDQLVQHLGHASQRVADLNDDEIIIPSLSVIGSIPQLNQQSSKSIGDKTTVSIGYEQKMKLPKPMF